MEIARMFGGWPHDLLAIPVSEYSRLKAYYFAVKEADERAGDPDDEDESDDDG